MLRTPYLPGESDMDQLKTIFRALGTPTEEEWPVRSPFLSSLLEFSFSFFVRVCVCRDGGDVHFELIKKLTQRNVLRYRR
jgi:hypothetical protein